MIACVDVHYHPQCAVAACGLAENWTDPAPIREWTARVDQVEDYHPGQFYLRELPCLMNVLDGETENIDVVVVDSYVWLDDGRGDDRRLGLGGHLYRALNGSAAVVGVAKTPFAGACAAEVCRGESKRPLYVSAAGMTDEQAARRVQSMHGQFRIPTLLKQVDRLCRSSSS